MTTKQKLLLESKVKRIYKQILNEAGTDNKPSMPKNSKYFIPILPTTKYDFELNIKKLQSLGVQIFIYKQDAEFTNEIFLKFGTITPQILTLLFASRPNEAFPEQGYFRMWWDD